MTLNEFRYIVAVAREKHFGHAADSCYVSQPTLSVAVKKLEDQLGIQLFERGKTEVRVTPDGEPIVEQAQRVLEEVEKLKRLAMQNKDQLAGLLKVGAIFTIGPYLFPQLISHVRKTMPDMPLKLDEDYTENLRHKLRHGELDVVIVALPFSEPEVETLPLYDEEFVPVFHEGHSWADVGRVDVNELADEPLLMLGPGHCFRDQVIEACPACLKGNSGDKFDKHWTEGSSLETIRYMVASGLGVTVMPVTALVRQPDIEGVDSRPFDEPVPQRRVALAYRRSFPRKQAVEALGEAIRAVLKDQVSLI